MREAFTNTASLVTEGYAVLPAVLSDELCDSCVAGLPEVESAGLRRALTKCPRASALLASPELQRCIADLAGLGAICVRSILFDKRPGTNWSVPWHQDVTIAVRERVETVGFGPWSVKDGVTHVRPPATLLAEMTTIRIHLDECGEDNGPLNVVPGSHAQGFLSSDAANTIRHQNGTKLLTVPRGGVVAFKPLLLHASSKSTSPKHRRVLHLEFAPRWALPEALVWADEL